MLNLTCNITLNEHVDVPLIVTTVWAAPEMVTTSSISTETTADEVDYMRYTSTNTFYPARSGNYTCNATVNSTSPYITGNQSGYGTLHINVCKQRDLNNFTLVFITKYINNYYYYYSYDLYSPMHASCPSSSH